MRHRAARAPLALASLLAAGLAVGGCTTGGAASDGSAPTPAATHTAAHTRAPVYGPPPVDPACVAALKAEQTLETRQGRDQNSESALDQDFTDFADALGAAAQQEKNPATAAAMTALADDYTALVESQSGAEDLPSMSAVENDGTAFQKACSS